jgi:hypothetical protein
VLLRIALGLAALLAAAPAAAQGLPAMPESLVGASLSACMRIDDQGAVNDVFLIVSTGDAARDRDAVDWLKRLHWPPRKPDDPERMNWFPMEVQLGGGSPAPEGPRKSCPPSA